MRSYFSTFFSNLEPKINHDSTHTSLPIDMKHIPDNVKAIMSEAYRKVAEVKVDSFQNTGRKSKYRIASINGFAMDSDQIVSDLAAANKNKLLGIDLGTGIGDVPKHINEVYKATNKVEMIGITAECLAKAPPYVIHGNIEDLPNVLTNLHKKPDFFISTYCMMYLSNPLKAIADAYHLLDDGGYLFLDDVYLPGFSENQGNELFRYLREKNGIDVIIGNSERHDGRQSWGQKWIFIKKNDKPTLDFPVCYSKEQLEMQTAMNGSYMMTQPRVKYEPSSDLINFMEHAQQNQDNDLTLKRLKQWGLTIPTKEPSTDDTRANFIGYAVNAVMFGIDVFGLFKKCPISRLQKNAQAPKNFLPF